ncbi:hypothetical protein LOC68_01520 [Blastopirellula sp. JC732]|uniref:Uncharacterized protein n=1 Tax=Blastopirellula sediminis TaxID=2894196 RepID=A0A9X1SHC0_9BACT|nr:hypothetical protein [Blastopirellula sediminis]MCC9608133.1 hypothetical protein [Blastopirellula sediminis]MCC9627074.1 hypothetical protein [Blastopirellula sediminis]
MNVSCHELAERIQTLQPTADVKDVARLCLLLSNSVKDPEQLASDETLTTVWKEVGLKLQAATDQHAAMTAELDELSTSDPRAFTSDQIWVLIRAIKVQSQILQLYVGQPALNV